MKKFIVDDVNPLQFDESPVIIGVCAMAKKAKSKPMKEILARMSKFKHISIIVFEEKTITESPIEEWPICNALISFYSHGFPLVKAIAYSKLRNPFLLNNLESQYILMNRKQVYEVLKRENISVPKYAVVERDLGLPEPKIIEHDDVVEIEGIVFQKPFVEKPVNAEEHDINIYFPSSAGGGSQHLFRKVGNLSSKYSTKFSRIRRDRSYIYEEFMPTDGTDVKVYTVGEDYAHAEARKSPALDGKVERDQDGKEVRYPVILTPREKIIAKKVSLGFKQMICGFDLLRANGMSYVCDVNGFSFVKSSRKYYDDCSHILGMIITREIAPQIFQPVYGFNTADPDDTPLVPTTCGSIMELRCVIGVIRHGDRTPKQKMKMEVNHPLFFSLFFRLTRSNQRELKLKRPKQLQEVLDIVREILDDIEAGKESEDKKPKYEQLKYVLEMHGSFSGINRKIQLKYQPLNRSKCKNNAEISSKDEFDSIADSSSLRTPKHGVFLLVAKWGGELTDAGRQQAEELGKAFRCIYPSGDGNYSKDPGLGLLRLHSTYRHDLKIYASDEGRVQMTAAAFTKGFLALEGELPPILVQMVKSANTNGLLDNDNHCTELQQSVKKRIKDVMSLDREFTKSDIETLVPTNSKSIKSAMEFVKNPRQVCTQLYNHVANLANNISKMSSLCQNQIKLYQDESWDLLARRWNKLLKDFRDPHTKDYDLSKISDIYDNIKYDVQHNPGILLEAEIQDFFSRAKALADIIVPQEYGITLEDKLLIGQRICTPLMRKILSDARYTEIDECTRLHAGYSKGVASPERFVRTRLYFTSESHLHSLLTIMRYGALSDPLIDQQWFRAMEFVSSVSELNYLSQIVIMIYEDPSERPGTPERYHVEVHFSPGAYALCHDIPEGTGFRSGNLQRMNSQNSVLIDGVTGTKTKTRSRTLSRNGGEFCRTDTLSSNSSIASSSSSSSKRIFINSYRNAHQFLIHNACTSLVETSPFISNEECATPMSRSEAPSRRITSVENPVFQNDVWGDRCESDESLNAPHLESNSGLNSFPLTEIAENNLNENISNSSLSPFEICDRHQMRNSFSDQTSAPLHSGVNNSDQIPSSSHEETITTSGRKFHKSSSSPQEDSERMQVHSTRSCPSGKFVITSFASKYSSAFQIACSDDETSRKGLKKLEKQQNPSKNRQVCEEGIPESILHAYREKGYTRQRIVSSGPDMVPQLCLSPHCRIRHSQWKKAVEAEDTHKHKGTNSEEIQSNSLKIKEEKGIRRSTSMDSLCVSKALHLLSTEAPVKNWLIESRQQVSFLQQITAGDNSLNFSAFESSYCRRQSSVSKNILSKTTSEDTKDASINSLETPKYRKCNVRLLKQDSKEIRENESINELSMKVSCKNITEQSSDVTQHQNTAANALTYPHGSAYHLDISRLLRESNKESLANQYLRVSFAWEYRRASLNPVLALGVPPPVSSCRSLISTAIIRGFGGSESIQSTSVPDIKQFLLSENDGRINKTTPKALTQTPDPDEDIMVPSAPCVNDLYPLETLHNSLTLQQLENFLLYQVTKIWSNPVEESSSINKTSSNNPDLP